MSKYKILYIEDNDDNFRLVARILLRMDLTADRAETAVSGIKMTQNNKYDLVLTDILLPDNTLREAYGNLLQPIRQQIGPDTPLVAITAHAFHFDEDFLLANGCDYYIAKPINLVYFQNLVKKLLQL
jgi:CheY-like chemotaxis protein